MKSRNTVFLIFLAGALATGTLFFASIIFNAFNVWVTSLAEANQKLLPPGFAAVTSILLCLGAYFRRERDNSDDGL